MTRVASAVFGLFFGLVSQASLATNYSDWWADPSYGGSSMNISQQGNSLGVAWYFYDGTGTPTWIFGVGNLTGATASVTLFSARGVTLGAPSSVTAATTGTATITFTSDYAATFAFSYSGTSAYLARSGQLTLKRYTLAPLPIAGSYNYAAKTAYSGCAVAASNGTSYPYGAFQITAANGVINITNTLTAASGGTVCTYSGTYTQNGSKISTSGTNTCSNGKNFTTYFDLAVTDDLIQQTGIAQQTAGGDTCNVSFWRNGTRQ